MSDIVKCEEVLNGLEVNWIGYVPPGGDGWRKAYAEEIGPTMRENRKKAELALKEVKEQKLHISKVQALAAEIMSKANLLSAEIALIDASPEDLLDTCTRISGIQVGARGVFRFADALLSVSKTTAEEKRIVEDIRFLDAFDAYITADQELDKIMYAMHYVNVKYRAKLLRACCRLLTVVEENREVIRHSKSVILEQTQKVLAPIFDTLDQAYALTGPHLRKLKKDFARNGISALASF